MGIIVRVFCQKVCEYFGITLGYENINFILIEVTCGQTQCSNDMKHRNNYILCFFLPHPLKIHSGDGKRKWTFGFNN